MKCSIFVTKTSQTIKNSLKFTNNRVCRLFFSLVRLAPRHHHHLNLLIAASLMFVKVSTGMHCNLLITITVNNAIDNANS